MNPSYNSGGQNGAGASGIPGAKPGVIASGPGPSGAASSGAMSTANGGVIASGPTEPILPTGPSRVPTGGRPGGVNFTNSADFSINDGSKKSKKKWVIAGIAGAVVVLVAVVVAVMLVGGNSGGNNNVAVGPEKDLFYAYANQLLGVTDGVNENSVYDKYEDYMVQLEYDDEDVEYFNSLNEAWQKFYESATEEEKYSEVSKLMGDVGYQNELMDFIIKYMNASDYYEDDIFEMYLNSGLDQTINMVQENYSELATTIFEPGADYAATKINEAIMMLEIFQQYDSVGCIANRNVDVECVTRNQDQLNLENLEKIGDVDDELIDETIEELVVFAFRIIGDFREIDNA